LACIYYLLQPEMDPTFSSVYQAYAEILRGMDATAIQRHPLGDPARWSAHQIVEHLLLTYRNTEELLRIRLKKGRPTQAPLTMRSRLVQFVVLKIGWYPKGMKAPGTVCPGGELSHLGGADLADSMRQELDAMDQVLDACARQFGQQRVASHFALGPLTVSQWRSFHTFHSERHLKQLKRTLL
jgi:hypothetical protein